MHRELGPEVTARARLLTPRTDSHVQARIRFNEFRYEFDQSGLRNVNLQITQEFAGQPFIDENSPVLGIVNELYDVELSIISLYQVSLSAAAHLPDESMSANRHRSRVLMRESG
jgi:hypothetical protein